LSLLIILLDFWRRDLYSLNLFLNWRLIGIEELKHNLGNLLLVRRDWNILFDHNSVALYVMRSWLKLNESIKEGFMLIELSQLICDVFVNFSLITKIGFLKIL